MHNYDILINDFLQYKHFLGFKYKSEKIILNKISKFLINNNFDSITKEVIESYARLNPNLSSNTISRNMDVFREFNKYLKYHKNIDCYQIPKRIYKQKHSFVPYIFNHDEIKTIYSNLNIPISNYRYSFYNQQSYPIIIKILYSTGMRIGEILNLKLSDYDKEKGIFILKYTKNNNNRIVALSDKLNEEMSLYYNRFYSNNSNKEELIFKMKITTIEKYFKNILKISNIKITDKGPRLHDLRHTFIVHNIEKEINNRNDLNVFLPILQAQVGHKKLNSLAYYFHITNDLLNIVNKISEKELSYLIKKEVDLNE